MGIGPFRRRSLDLIKSMVEANSAVTADEIIKAHAEKIYSDRDNALVISKACYLASLKEGHPECEGAPVPSSTRGRKPGEQKTATKPNLTEVVGEALATSSTLTAELADLKEVLDAKDIQDAEVDEDILDPAAIFDEKSSANQPTA